jgi:o-succinylbenzoate synthase
MDCYFWRYELAPKRRLSAIARDAPREGALIRVGGGFADVHPWPELGDLPLDEQLALLARGETTALTRRSLSFASIDARARLASRSLFEGLTIPPSHWPGSDPPAAFGVAKLKSIERLPERVRLRIDFNATLTADEFLQLRLPGERIDFIEDPCPYDPATWRMLREKTGLRLALDREVAEEGVDVLVVKPAVQEMPSTSREIVVTSYMDHAIGQFFAAFVAASHRITNVCGLFTHVLYEPDPFFERVRADGARLLAPGGTGIGFDDLLESLPWKKLA